MYFETGSWIYITSTTYLSVGECCEGHSIDVGLQSVHRLPENIMAPPGCVEK